MPFQDSGTIFSDDVPAQLFAALTSNKGLQHIIDTAFSLLGNPLFVTDSGYHFLARQTGPIEDDGTPFSQELRRDSLYPALQEDQIEIIKNWNLDDMTYKNDGVYAFYNEGFEANAVVSFIRVRGSIVARMMMVEKNTFTDNTYEYFAFLSMIISQELQKDTFKTSLENRPDSEMLFHVLNTSKPSQEVIDKRLKMMDIHLKEKFQVAVVHSREGMLKSLQISSICYRLEKLLPEHIHTIFQDNLVLLIQLNANQSLKKETLLLIQKEALHNDLQIGISNEFQNLADVKQFYRQANTAVQMGRRYHFHASGEDSLYLYRDYSCIDLINTASHTVELQKFCHPYLTQLMRYDQENHTALLNTLYEFLQNQQNFRETSNALFIHKNTLSYRINRIRDILDDDLTSSETILSLNVSFRILIFLQLFTPAE